MTVSAVLILEGRQRLYIKRQLGRCKGRLTFHYQFLRFHK